MFGGTCYTEHALNQFKQLGLDHQRAIQLACKLYAHSVMYANKHVTTRRVIKNKNTSHSQALEPGASRRVSSAYHYSMANEGIVLAASVPQPDSLRRISLLSVPGSASPVKQDNLRCKCPWGQACPKRTFAET
eukprot:1156265-Pelagomonas_calceolata.AAC.1